MVNKALLLAATIVVGCVPPGMTGSNDGNGECKNDSPSPSSVTCQKMDMGGAPDMTKPNDDLSNMPTPDLTMMVSACMPKGDVPLGMTMGKIECVDAFDNTWWIGGVQIRSFKKIQDECTWITFSNAGVIDAPSPHIFALQGLVSYANCGTPQTDPQRTCYVLTMDANCRGFTGKLYAKPEDLVNGTPPIKMVRGEL